MGQPGLLYREILCQKKRKKIKKPFYKMFVLDFHSRDKISILKGNTLFGFMVSEVSIRGWSSQLFWPFWELEENTVKQTEQQRVGEGAERAESGGGQSVPTFDSHRGISLFLWHKGMVVLLCDYNLNKGREYRPVVELWSSTKPGFNLQHLKNMWLCWERDLE